MKNPDLTLANIEALSVNDETAAELTARAKHDLGKYIGFESRWLADDCSDHELLTALQSDIIRTASGPVQVKSAFDIWRGLYSPLVSAVGSDSVEPIERLMTELEQFLPLLGASSAPDGCRGDLDRVRVVAQAVGKALSVLHKETRGR